MFLNRNFSFLRNKQIFSISISNTIGPFIDQFIVCFFKHNLTEQYMGCAHLGCVVQGPASGPRLVNVFSGPLGDAHARKLWGLKKL